MAKLPDPSQINRLIPQSDRRIVGYNSGYEGDALNSAGQQIGRVADELQGNQDKLEYAYAKSNLLRSQVDAEQQLQSDPNYTGYKDKYVDLVTKSKEQSASMISNPRLRAMFDVDANMDITRGVASVNSMARQKEVQHGQATLDETIGQNLDALSRTSDPGQRVALIDATNQSISGAADRNYITPEQALTKRQAFPSAYIETFPADQQVKLLKPTFTTAPSGAAPRDFNADTVKPYTPEQIKGLSDLVNKPSEYDSIFKEAAMQNGLDWKELKLRAAAESSLRPDAKGEPTPYGQSVGIMQLTEDTAKNLGVTDRSDARQSIFGGAKLLAQHVQKAGGDLSTVDKLYYGGDDQSKWGANTNQYAENLAAVRGTGAAGSPAWVYQIPVEKRIEIIRRNQGYMRGDLEQRVQDSVAMAEQGVKNPNPIDRSEFYLAYDGLQAEQKYRTYSDMQTFGESVYKVATLTPGQQAEVLAASKPVAATEGFAEKQKNYEHLVTAVSEVNKTRNDDPIGFAQGHGLMENKPLNFSDAPTLQQQLKDRGGIASMMYNTYGTELKLMTNDEAKRFSQAMDEMPTNTRLAYLKNFRDSVNDPQMYQALLQQVRPDSPVTAMAGMYLGLDKTLSGQNPWYKRDDETVTAEHVAEYLVHGEALLNPSKADKKENGVGKEFPMPQDGGDKGMRAAFDSYSQKAFANQPQAANQAYQAYRAYYASSAAAKGMYSGELDEDISKQSFRAVVGNVVQKGSRSVVAPWGMDETTFNDAAKVNFNTQAKMQGYNPATINWDNVSLENTGEPAKYRAIVGAGYLLDKNKRPLVISLSPSTELKVPLAE